MNDLSDVFFTGINDVIKVEEYSIKKQNKHELAFATVNEGIIFVLYSSLRRLGRRTKKNLEISEIHKIPGI